MKKLIKFAMILAATGFIAAPATASDAIDGGKLFAKKCKMCHAVDKKKTGPALKAMSQDEARLRDVITNGGKNKMMKAWGKKFSAAQIDALVAHIRSRQ
jgi:mono/diheme cytochrome c family protein